jgi:hypothetical protein
MLRPLAACRAASNDWGYSPSNGTISGTDTHPWLAGSQNPAERRRPCRRMIDSPATSSRPWRAIFKSGAKLLQETIADFLQSFRVLRELPSDQLERLGNLLVDRLWLLCHKLEHSQFEPVMIDDHFGVNSNFPAALTTWVSQFDTDQSKVGALLIALNVQFFTRPQFDSLLTDVVERYDFIRHDEPRGTFRTHARPLTPHTDLHSRFARQAQINHTIPDDVNLEKFNHQAANLLSNSSHETEIPTPYYSLKECVRDLLDLDCIIVEDWSLSGTTLAYGIADFLRICKLVFGDEGVRDVVAAANRALPRVRAVTLIATNEAIERLQKVVTDRECTAYTAAKPLIYGCLLGANDRITRDDAPAGLRQLSLFVPQLDWRACVLAALNEFEAKAGEALVAFAKRLGFPDRTNWSEFVSFGFNRGGWLAVSHANCPSNSLPILWYHNARYRPLFHRSESNHVSYRPEVRSWLADAEKNQRRLMSRLREAVTSVVLL